MSKTLAADQRASAPRYTHTRFDGHLWAVLDCKTGFLVAKIPDQKSARRVARVMNRRHVTGHETPVGGREEGTIRVGATVR